ncbi:MAG: hypothetical protein WBA73_13970 [Devosia sp.]
MSGAVWLPDDAILPIKPAAYWANCSPDILVIWSRKYGLGRQVEKGAPWRILAAAAMMRSEGNGPALTAFLAGDRKSDLVKPYIARAKEAEEDNRRRQGRAA